jgi:catechol 2,3-dioxygenase-like lactoylglutathione lyase family enzyme
MMERIGVVGLYVHDQDEALNFYVGKLGFQVHTDARNGNYRWLTVKHPNQPSFELGLFLPQEPVLDAATANIMREMVAKGRLSIRLRMFSKAIRLGAPRSGLSRHRFRRMAPHRRPSLGVDLVGCPGYSRSGGTRHSALCGGRTC